MRVSYHPKVRDEDIPRLGHVAAGRIRVAIEGRLMAHPDKLGLPLRRGLHGYKKFRVGDYRVIYRLDGEEIKILIIGHRKDIYDRIKKRQPD
jgi:mRNA interferase RelE/StbE